MKKKLTLLLTLAMLLGLAACGNKTDTSTGTGANPSKENSEAVEKETGAVESVVGEVVDAIEEAVRPQPGDVTDKMYFADGISFTSATPLEFEEWFETPTSVERPSLSTTISYLWKNENHYAGIGFQRGDGFIVSLFDPLNTPEGAYQGTMSYEGYVELKFQAEGNDGEKYEIVVISAADVDTYKPDEEYINLFFQLVNDFLNSGITAESKMSDIQYDKAVLSESNTANFFTSPDAIEAE